MFSKSNATLSYGSQLIDVGNINITQSNFNHMCEVFLHASIYTSGSCPMVGFGTVG